MVNHIDKTLNLKKDYLIESINNAFNQERLNIIIGEDSSQSESSLIWNIYADHFGYGYFVLECVHILTDINIGPYFEWYILKKEHSHK